MVSVFRIVSSAVRLQTSNAFQVGSSLLSEIEDMQAFLVLIESAGNQRHIFETNKLRENVGASQQIAQLGTQFVINAVHEVLKPAHPSYREINEVSKIKQEELNPPLETQQSPGVEVWYVSSGKAMLLVKEREIGREIIRNVTLRALKELPGVRVYGGIEPVDLASSAGLFKAIKHVHTRVAKKRSALPSPASRFLRLPVVAGCRTSGLPASTLDTEKNAGPRPLMSLVSQSKAGMKEEAQGRMQNLVPELYRAKQIQDIEAGLGEKRFLAVIHADGNGVGKIFENFDVYTNGQTARQQIKTLREFSLELDCCTKKAFQLALEKMGENEPSGFTVLPLVLAGDDVTVVMDGTKAVPFAALFLQAFEREVEESEIIAPIAKSAFGVPRLGMGAGIAIVKPHYPFFNAYSLSEDLARHAKQFVKKRVVSEPGKPLPCCSLDFHVHHASSGDSLDEIRKELELEPKGHGDSERLYGGPYVVTQPEKLNKLGDAVISHQFKTLEEWVGVLSAKEPDDSTSRALPRSQMHDLRAALREGRTYVEERVKLIEDRYELLKKLTPLYWEEAGPAPGSQTTKITRLLDALTLAKLGQTYTDNSVESTDSEARS